MSLELRLLGCDVAQATVAKYMPKTRKPPSQTWRTFLDNHIRDIVTIDFFTVPTLTFRVLYGFLVLHHDQRQVVHFNVTEHPTAQWTAQQIVEAFPFDEAPRFLLRDRDGIYVAHFQRRVQNRCIEEVVIAPQSPWQNLCAERMIGTLRRELLGRVIVFNEAYLYRLVQLRRPLDFTAVTDHAEFFGEMQLCTRAPDDTRGRNHFLCDMMRSGKPHPRTVVSLWGAHQYLKSIRSNPLICHPSRADCPPLAVSMWKDIQDAAEAYYDRTPACKFTTFIAYEYSGQAGLSSLHRNVIFRNEAVIESPIDAVATRSAAPLLWKGLQKECIEAGDTPFHNCCKNAENDPFISRTIQERAWDFTHMVCAGCLTSRAFSRVQSGSQSFTSFCSAG